MSFLTSEKERLFKLDEQLRAEADELLQQTGLGQVIAEAGYKAVGSYSMKLMTWRDLDFERISSQPDWQQHWEFGALLARNPLVWGYRCLNAYRSPQYPADEGYYWGLEVTGLQGEKCWKIDLWTARAEEFMRATPKRSLWNSKLNDENRFRILAIKEAVCGLPEYRSSMLSVHIYEAVLENNVRSPEEFLGWWRKQYGNNR
jgi:hypothetical protein